MCLKIVDTLRAATAIIGSNSIANPIPLIILVLLLSNFLVDAIFTLVKRIVKK